MSLPVNEDQAGNWVTTRDVSDGPVNHIEFEATADLLYGDIVIHLLTSARPFVGFVELAAVTGDTARIDITEGIELAVRNANKDPGSTFTTLYADVWYNPVNGLFYDAGAAGYWMVGKVSSIQVGTGPFKYLKRRYAIEHDNT